MNPLGGIEGCDLWGKKTLKKKRIYLCTGHFLQYPVCMLENVF